jgi:hypothetical protein
MNSVATTMNFLIIENIEKNICSAAAQVQEFVKVCTIKYSCSHYDSGVSVKDLAIRSISNSELLIIFTAGCRSQTGHLLLQYPMRLTAQPRGRF